MTKTGKIVLLVFSGLVVVAGLIYGGIVIDRLLFRGASPFGIGPWGMMGGGWFDHGPGMMWDNDRYDYGPGMMWDDDRYEDYGPGMMWDQDGAFESCPNGGGYAGYGHGMMWGGGYSACGEGQGYGGMHGPGMMGGYWQEDADLPVLSIEQAEEAIGEYLEGTEDLHIAEIMIFSNHAYAQIVEESTGIGAFEVLVDPVTLDVYPEHGPNMMWNLKYGMHGSRGYDAEEAEISEEDAAAAAQAYLDAASPGYEADEHADLFYGYYTLHILLDGEVTGMLSVNSITGEVFPHTWHGDFIEMTGEH